MERITRNAVEIGARTTQEQIPSPEVFRGSIGFDFIFVQQPDGTKKPYCIEFNTGAGVRGLTELSDPNNKAASTTKIMAKIRAHEDPSFTAAANELKERFQSGTPAENIMSRGQNMDDFERLHAQLENTQRYPNGYKNPEWLHKTFSNKTAGNEVIPVQYQARKHRSIDEEPRSSTGLWIVKNISGAEGFDIEILSDAELTDRISREGIGLFNRYVVEECLPASGADLAEAGDAAAPASLRLLLDFRCLEDGSVKIDFGTGYQRVANPEAATSDPRIVNHSTGAKAVPASKEELAKATEIATEIIKNIAQRRPA